jgi:hypothetical protein
LHCGWPSNFNSLEPFARNYAQTVPGSISW